MMFTGEKMELREYKPSDCVHMVKLFYDTVHSVNAKDYTPPQLDAWAPADFDLSKWNASFLAHFTVVAVERERIIGFGDVDETGYLDRLYVHKDYQGRGIATAICDCLENAIGTDRIITHSSVTAKPFFEKRGYRTIKKQEVERKGIILTNYVMEKRKNKPL